MTIPPVVARIFSGDSTSPLTREARTWCGARDYCPFAMVVGMKRLVGVKQSLRLDGRKVCNIKMVSISQVNAIMLRFVPAANPPPFDKGGKCGGARRGIVRFWKGW